METDCGVHLQAVPQPHCNSPARSLEMGPPRRLGDDPFAGHLLHTIFVVFPRGPLPCCRSRFVQAIHQRALPFHAAFDEELGISLSVKGPVDEFFERLRQCRVLTARFSSRRNLHNALLCTALKSHFFQKIARICQKLICEFCENFQKFCEIRNFSNRFFAKILRLQRCKRMQIL